MEKHNMSGEVKRSQDREPSRARGTPSILRASAHFASAVAIMTLGCGHLLPSQKMNAVGFDVALAEVAKTALDARSKGVPLGDEVEVEFAVKTSYSGKAEGTIKVVEIGGSAGLEESSKVKVKLDLKKLAATSQAPVDLQNFLKDAPRLLYDPRTNTVQEIK
jgi:hypothetical protein